MSKYLSVKGYCSKTKKPLGLQLKVEDGLYIAVGSFAVSEGGPTEGGQGYTGKLVAGASFACKHCGNNGVIQCNCGTILCVKEGQASVECPHCGTTANISWVEDVSQLSETSIKGSRQ